MEIARLLQKKRYWDQLNSAVSLRNGTIITQGSGSFFFWELLVYRLPVATTTRRLSAPARPVFTGKNLEAKCAEG